MAKGVRDRIHLAALYQSLVLLGAASAVILAACGPTVVIEVTATSRPAQAPAVAAPLTPLEITYVDGDCFLIAADGHKILIDPYSSFVPREITTAIEQALPPFDDVDLVLATHSHRDHFDPTMVGTHLQYNQEAVFASTQRAVDQLQSEFPVFFGSERVRAFDPGRGERVRATLNGIDVEVVSLPHDCPVVNIGFLIDIGGRRLLHTGDTFPHHIESYDFPSDDIDIAFVPYFPLLEAEFLVDGESLLPGLIQARRLAPMHYSPSQGGLESTLAELAARYPDSILFHRRMETVVVR